jgi:hypothetical protein
MKNAQTKVTGTLTADIRSTMGKRAYAPGAKICAIKYISDGSVESVEIDLHIQYSLDPFARVMLVI